MSEPMEPLCTCPAMEKPHVRNMFTDCHLRLPELPYVPAVIPPDPARDARVAARRAADARRAGAALDKLLREVGMEITPWQREVIKEWAAADVESRLHHNRDYGVPAPTGYNGRDPETGRPLCEHNADAEACDRDHLYPRMQHYVTSDTHNTRNAHYGVPDQGWCLDGGCVAVPECRDAGHHVVTP